MCLKYPNNYRFITQLDWRDRNLFCIVFDLVQIEHIQLQVVIKAQP